MDNNLENKLTRKERRALRRVQKDETQKAQQRRQTMKRTQNYFIIFIILFAVGFGIYFLAKNFSPKGEDFSQAIPLMGATHIAPGTPLPEYNSDPPTSGPHYGLTARSGFRDEIIEDQYLIHNLEHGDIWIAYHPRVSASVKEQLKQFTAAKVIITPRDNNETDITLAAWGRLDTFNVENDIMPIERIKDFIKRYINKGPEKVMGASGGI